MLGNLGDPRKAAVFYAIALALAFVLAVFFSSELGQATAQLTMITPALAVVVMMLLETKEGGFRDGWTSLGIACGGLLSPLYR